MVKRGRLKISSVLIALNILVLVLIVIFYGFRLVKYYIKENNTNALSGETYMYDVITGKRSYVDLNNGLVFSEEDNVYRYKGEVNDNYLLYSGILYRIVAIDNENNIRLISDSSVTLMYSGLEKGFKDSYVNKWLNKSEIENSGKYESNMFASDTTLSNTYLCNDVIDDVTKITCENNTNDTKMSILSLYDYKEAGGKSSYLNNKENYYLSTLNSSNANYYVNSDGEIGLSKITTKIYGLRPVITLNENTLYLSGKGTKDDPYIIESHDIKKLSDVYVGDTIKYSNNTFKVTQIEDGKVKVVSSNILVDGDKSIEKTFGGSSNKYSENKNTIGNYLNNSYYNSLEKNNYIVKSDWYIGQLLMSDLDYSKIYDTKVSANIGMLGLSELFVGEGVNTLTITRGIESNIVIDVINKSGSVFGDLVSSLYNVRPSFCLNGDIEISSGNGKTDNPYILGELNETKVEE